MDGRKIIATIVGARPQFVKAAVVSKAIEEAGGMTEIMIHTGQHYDYQLSGAFFDELEMKTPDHWLEVGSGSHGIQTGEMMIKIEPVLIKAWPDAVIVYGDTNSTLAGATVAAKLNIPVAHVEAGLRSFNARMPEEINRRIADHVSSLLFCPTITAEENLRDEGIRDGIIHSGDVMYDVALQYGPIAERKSHILDKLALTNRKFILATIHRAENTDDASRLETIFSAFRELSRDLPVVLPLHPRTRKMARLHNLESLLESLTVIEPVGFLDMLMLVRNASLICTDSGGVQKEAYFHKTLCITIRDQTEWVETVQAGWNVLVAPDSAAAIIEAAQESLGKDSPNTEISEYGDGRAANIIADALKRRLS